MGRGDSAKVVRSILGSLAKIVIPNYYWNNRIAFKTNYSYVYGYFFEKCLELAEINARGVPVKKYGKTVGSLYISYSFYSLNVNKVISKRASGYRITIFLDFKVNYFVTFYVNFSYNKQ